MSLPLSFSLKKSMGSMSAKIVTLEKLETRGIKCTTEVDFPRGKSQLSGTVQMSYRKHVLQPNSKSTAITHRILCAHHPFPVSQPWGKQTNWYPFCLLNAPWLRGSSTPFQGTADVFQKQLDGKP